MKKLLSFAVIAGVIAVSLVGARYWAGVRIEKDYRRVLAAVPANAAFRVTGESYSRGAFSSVARTGVEFLGVPEGPIAFSLVHRITHGPLAPTRLAPFLAVVETTLEPAETSSAAVKAFFSAYPEVVAVRDRTVVSLDGEGVSHLELPAFRRPFGEKQITVDWQGLVADTTVAKDWSAYRGASKLTGLVVSAAAGEVKVGAVEGTYDVRKGTGDLFFGESGVTVGSVALLSAKGEATERFALSGLKLRSNTKEEGGLVTLDFSLLIDTLQAGGMAFVHSGFDVRLSNFETAFIARLKKELDGVGAAGDALNREKALAGIAGLAREHLPSFLSKGPVVEVPRFEVATGEGRFSATARLSLETAQEPPADLKGLLGLLVAQVEATLDEALLRQIVVQSMTTQVQARGQSADPAQIQAAADMLVGTQLQSLVQRGYLRKDKGTFSASAKYQGGQLAVNGIPLGGTGRKGNR